MIVQIVIICVVQPATVTDPISQSAQLNLKMKAEYSWAMWMSAYRAT
jgi:hypothetical protein